MSSKSTFIESLYIPVSGLCYIAFDRAKNRERMAIYVRPYSEDTTCEQDCERHVVELVTERTEVIASRTGAKDEYPIFSF